MIDTVIKKIKITKDLQSKISWACTFSKVVPKIIEGNLHIVEKTNLAYVEPHIFSFKQALKMVGRQFNFLLLSKH